MTSHHKVSMGTPDLTPSHSNEVSPAFSTYLESPSLPPLDLNGPSTPRIASGTATPLAVQDTKKLVTGADGRIIKLPECWGHRGASADYPENTKASFVAACKAGADGIESDVHITKDNLIVMFHDPDLSRTTDGKGRIEHQDWVGCLEHVRTLEAPHQPIPLFTEVIDMLMQPEHIHVKLNIDCKPGNDPAKLFGLIKDVIERVPNWRTDLAPRLILGLWHPKFILPATNILPYLPRFAIVMSIPLARQYFFSSCHGFSVAFEALADNDGAKFREECKRRNKELCVWTVNLKEEMKECVKWGVKSVISDKPGLWRVMRKEIQQNPSKALSPTLVGVLSPYLLPKYYGFSHRREAQKEYEYIESEAGPFDAGHIPLMSLDED